MRKISKIISAALMVILAVACNTKEIDNPDLPDNPDKPQISDNVKITAGIKQTRVGYSVNGDELVPCWERGDVIFGYYGPAGDEENTSKIVFKVADVDMDGVATLEAVDNDDWKDFLEQLKNDEELPVGLMYTGTTETNKDILFNGNSVSVDMTEQNGKNIPACMQSCFFELPEEQDGEEIKFLFNNCCAILEIESLTGIAEDAGLEYGNAPLALTSLKVTNLIPTYEFSYCIEYGVDGVLDCQSGDDPPTTYNIDLSSDTWTVNYDGSINNSTDTENLLIAVAPYIDGNLHDILITATIEGKGDFSYLYSGRLQGGNCYRIKKKNVVAKTADGQYFTTVNGAFDHAAKLFSANKYDSEHNIVTLVEDCSFGDDDINIDGYDVILDLNGKTLSQDGESFFYVRYDADEDCASENNSTFTIRDRTGDGKIKGDNGWYIVYNYGVLNIKSGSLDAVGNTQTIYNEDSGTINITGGELSCINWPVIGNHGETTITGGTISVDEKCVKETCEVINNSGTLTIDGGTITSAPDLIAIANPGTLNINGGTISSKNGYAVNTWGTATITGGEISSVNNYAVYAVGGKVHISQGEISSTSSETGAMTLVDTKATISGGTITGNGEGKSTIYASAASELEVSGGRIICMGTRSAIECLADGLGKNPTVIVKWAGDATSFSENIEPLLYSISAAPIFDYSSNLDCYHGYVTIKGGFLYDARASNDDSSISENSAFFEADNSYGSLQQSSGYYFYSNTANTIKATTQTNPSVKVTSNLDVQIVSDADLGDLTFTSLITIDPYTK